MISRLRAIARETVAIAERGGYRNPQGAEVRIDVETAVYSPSVPVFRDDAGMLLTEPYPVTFLTSAAPNLAAIRRSQPELASEVPAVLRRRAARVLAVAAAHGHRRLVLGAWGCGVFGNDPATVAEAFSAALARHPMDHVVFAILGANRAAFTAVFAGGRR